MSHPTRPDTDLLAAVKANDQALATRRSAETDWWKADAAWRKAVAEHEGELRAQYDREWPDNVWAVRVSSGERPTERGAMNRRPHLVPCIVAAVMALVAIADLPYGYYTLMRLVVCATAVFVLVVAARSRQMWAVWLFGMTALLFNPIVPVHLTKGMWQPIDFIAGTMLVTAAFVIRTETPPMPA